MKSNLRSFVVALLVGTIPAVAVPVSFLSNPSFGDTSGEVPNMRNSITGLGHAVTQFSDISATGFSTALTGADVLVIPELEIASLYPALSLAARASVLNFVNGGGGLIVAGDGGSKGIALLNGIFGYSLLNSTFTASGSTNLNVGSAAGTSFAGGPSTLANSNGTQLLQTSSLPGSSLGLYTSGGQTSVFVKDQGLGYVAFVGFDWFQSPTPGTWNQVLNSAITYQSSSASVPDPAATFALLGIALTTLVGFRRMLRAA